MLDAVVALAEGNPGAVTVMGDMLRDGGRIDPDSFGGYANILDLDSYGIYGSRIWMLFKDVCRQSLPRTIAILRAVQLGYLDEKTLNHAIDNRGEGLDVEAMVAKVKERLPNFQV